MMTLESIVTLMGHTLLLVVTLYSVKVLSLVDPKEDCTDADRGLLAFAWILYITMVGVFSVAIVARIWQTVKGIMLSV